jgi:hypothetical protein
MYNDFVPVRRRVRKRESSLFLSANCFRALLFLLITSEDLKQASERVAVETGGRLASRLSAITWPTQQSATCLLVVGSLLVLLLVDSCRALQRGACSLV